MKKINKPYVQFSKRCVMFVLISVTVIVAGAVTGMIVWQDFADLGELMRCYLSFSGVVFVAYSGNSVLEKALLAWVKTRKPDDDKQSDDDGNVG